MPAGVLGRAAELLSRAALYSGLPEVEVGPEEASGSILG